MMPLPKSLQQGAQQLGALAPIGVPPSQPPNFGAPPGPPPGGGGDESNSFPFDMQKQSQTNWCWSAVAASVEQFYESSSASWTQCKIVNSELSQSTCCTNGSTLKCDQPWYLDTALSRVGHYNAFGDGPLAMNGLMIEISSKQPVGARIAWPGRGAHFVVLHGYSVLSGDSFVDIRDPWDQGEYTYSYDQFCTAYNGTGVWSHHYFTRP
jgi:hypothetical protein